MITSTTQTLLDGERNVVMQFTGICDGTGGDEVAATKVDVSAMSPVPLSVKILKISYDVSGGILRLLWDADDDVPFLDLASPGSEWDYRRIGGLVNGGGPSATGNINFTTLGFDVGSSYSIKIDMVKKFP